MAEIPLLQQLKDRVAAVRYYGFEPHLFERAIVRIEELEALVAEGQLPVVYRHLPWLNGKGVLFAIYGSSSIQYADELEAVLAERESTWRAKREEQWKRENPMGSTPIETTPIRANEMVSEAEYQNHLPWCRARRAGYLNRGACNCAVGTTRGRAKATEQPAGCGCPAEGHDPRCPHPWKQLASPPKPEPKEEP